MSKKIMLSILSVSLILNLILVYILLTRPEKEPVDLFNYTVTFCYGEDIKNIEACFDVKTQFNRLKCENRCFLNDCYYLCYPVMLRKPAFFIQTDNMTLLNFSLRSD